MILTGKLRELVLEQNRRNSENVSPFDFESLPQLRSSRVQLLERHCRLLALVL